MIAHTLTYGYVYIVCMYANRHLTPSDTPASAKKAAGQEGDTSPLANWRRSKKRPREVEEEREEGMYIWTQVLIDESL